MMDENQQETMQEKLAAFDSYSYPELANAMLEARTQYELVKANSARLYREFQFIQRQVIPARMDRDQIVNITVELADGSRKQLIVLSQVSVKTPAERKLELWQWLREHDAGDIISETVNSSTLAAYVREQMKKGEPYPNDICEVTMYDTASLRKA